jgi:hypothetical protein
MSARRTFADPHGADGDVEDLVAGVVVPVPDAGGFARCRTLNLVLDNRWKNRPFIDAEGLFIDGEPATVRELLVWLTSAFHERGTACRSRRSTRLAPTCRPTGSAHAEPRRSTTCTGVPRAVRGNGTGTA